MEQNKVQLIGYVGSSPEMKVLENGRKRAGLRVATHDIIRREGDKKIYGTIWHEVIAWGCQAEYAERSFVKGSKILVEGAISYRTFIGQTGHKKYFTQIEVRHLMNLDR